MKNFVLSIIALLSISSLLYAQPGWTQVNYTSATTTYGIVTIDGNPAESGDIVGAFVGSECRAVGEVIINNSVAYINFEVQGQEVETVGFKVWQASTNTICDVSFTTQTNPQGNIGYPPNYLPIAATSPPKPELDVSPDYKIANFKSGTTSFEVSNIGDGTMNWTTVSNHPWVTITSGESGSNSGTINVGHTQNPGAARIGTITVTADGATGSPKTIEIRQSVAPTKYIVTSTSYSPNAGGQVTITAQLADGSDNSVAVGGQTVTWSSTNGGSFSSSTSQTNAQGTATVTYTASQSAGTIHAVTATDGDGFTGTSPDITTQPGPATKYSVTVNNNNPTVGTQVNILAQLTDQYDNPVATAGKTVTWSSTNGGTFSFPTSQTNAQGIATIDFTVSQTSNIVHAVTGTDGDNYFGTSESITTKPDVASKYIVTSNNYSPIVGSQVNISAQLSDQYDNPVSTAGKNVDWSSTNGGSFSAGSSNTNAQGIATVSFAVSETAGTVHTVTGSDGDGYTGVTGNITTQVGAGTKYIVTSNNYSPIVGTDVTINAQLVDEYDNNVPTSGKTVTWSKTTTTQSLSVRENDVNKTEALINSIELNGGEFSATSSETNTQGLATVTFTVSQTAGVVHTVIGTDGDNKTGTSPNITTQVGPASQYLVTSSNYNPSVSSVVEINAQLSDQFGNSVLTAGKSVTWTSTNGGEFASATTATNSQGIATVDFTVSSNGGIVHVVTATDGDNFTGDTSDITTAAIGIPVLRSPNDDDENVSISPDLSWDAVTNATHYHLQLARDVNFNNIVHEDDHIVATTENVPGLQYSTEYFWKVRAKNSQITGDWSGTFSFTTLVEKPEIPQLETPENHSTGLPLNLTLEWDAALRADTYNLQVSEDDNFSTTIVDANGITNTFYELTGLNTNTKYFWHVSATNAGGTSEDSGNWDFTTIDILSAPTDLTATSENNGTQMIVNLNWQDNSNNEDGFVIERKGPNDNDFVLLTDGLAANSSSFTDNDVLENETHEYRIKAVNANGESEYSNTETILIPVSSITPPSNLNVQPDPNGNNDLTWDDNSNNEDGFIIERGGNGQSSMMSKSIIRNSNTLYVAIDTVEANNTNYKDENTQEGIEYEYRVCAYNDEGVSVALPAPAPVIPLIAPSSLEITIVDNFSVQLEWVDNSNSELGFYVMRASKPEMTYKCIDSTETDEIVFIDNDIIDGTTFFYKVCAYNILHGTSADTDTDSVLVPLIPPSNLNSTMDDENIRISWDDNSEGEDGYIIERKIEGGEYIVIDTVDVDSISFLDTSVEDNTTYTYRVKGFNTETSSEYAEETTITEVDDDSQLDKLPTEYLLYQNYPNPFNPSTIIQFSLPQRDYVRITIYNILGEVVRTLVEREFNVGYHKIEFDASNLSSGIYIYRLSTKGYQSLNKMLLIK